MTDGRMYNSLIYTKAFDSHTVILEGADFRDNKRIFIRIISFRICLHFLMI